MESPLVWTVAEDDAGQRLDRYVRKRFGKVPLSHLYRLIRKGGIRVNGRRVAQGALLAAGDRVEAELPAGDVREKRPPDPSRVVGTPFFTRNFLVLYEDGDLLAVDKPEGLLAHPAEDARHRLTLIDLAKGYLAAKRDEDRSAAPGDTLFEPALVHRIDQRTSGVLLIAKTGEALRRMTELFRDGAIEKEYAAIVKGVPKQREGTIAGSLSRATDPKTGKAWIHISDKEGAREARSRYVVERGYGRFALLSIWIETGRMHQIRVHLSSIGHPVVGDARYGDYALNKRVARDWGTDRMFLHARRAAFAHPRTGRPLEIVAHLPTEFERSLDRLSGPGKQR